MSLDAGGSTGLHKAVVCAVLLLFCDGVRGYSSGAPPDVCDSLIPGHPVSTVTGNGGYLISVPSGLPRRTQGSGFNFQAGIAYNIAIVRETPTTPNFLGFVLQAVSPGTTTPIGSFSSPGGSRKFMACSAGGMYSVTHSQSESRSDEQFIWNSPNNNDGAVEFRYTIVRSRTPTSIYYAALLASDNNFIAQSPPTTPPPPPSDPTTVPMSTILVATDDKSSTAPPVFPMTSTSEPPSTDEPNSSSDSGTQDFTLAGSSPTLPGGGVGVTTLPNFPTTPESTVVKIAAVSKTRAEVDAILNERSGFRGGEVTVRYPGNCERAQCTMYASIRTWPGNRALLDIYMEGNAVSWVAVGFTMTASMNSADVIACVRYSPTERVLVLDSWNINSGKFNEPDENQNDVEINFGQFEDGRISCRVNRTVVGSSASRDFDLNGDYFILYGVSDQSFTPTLSAPRLNAHGFSAEAIPRITPSRQNVVTATNPDASSGVTTDPSSGGVRVHLSFIVFIICDRFWENPPKRGECFCSVPPVKAARVKFFQKKFYDGNK